MRSFFVILISLFSVNLMATEAMILFHAGPREYIQKNIETHAISQQDLDQFIMPKSGNKSNFGLVEYREGLYGAEQISEVGIYSFYQMQNGREPQIMMIEVDPHCVDQKFQSSYEYEPVSPENIFSVWVQKNNKNYQNEDKNILNRCRSILSPSGRSVWKQGQPYADAPAIEGEDDRLCQKVLNDFLTDQNIKVISDTANDTSWYIRDRSCVKNISGTADDLLKAIAENKIGLAQQYLSQNLYGDIVVPGHFSMGITFVVLRALSESKAIFKDNEINIQNIIQDLKETVADQASSQELLLDRNFDNYIILQKSFQAAQKAAKSKTLQALQKKLSKYLNELLIDLKSHCSGNHGVALDKQKACHQVSVRQSKALLNILR